MKEIYFRTPAMTVFGKSSGYSSEGGISLKKSGCLISLLINMVNQLLNS